MSMNLNSGSDLIAEDDLRTALRPHRIDANRFEAGVWEKIQAAQAERANDPLAGASELLRVAAATILPLPVITGGKVAAIAPPLAHASVISKLLGYVALPAISLFVMVGAFVFGAIRIGNVQRNNVPASPDLLMMREATNRWWRQNKWLARLVMAATIILPFLGATSLLVLLYLISLGVLLYVLSGLARRGLGNRQLIGGSCVAGLGLLGQASASGMIGRHDIHFVDQMLLPAIFLAGALILIIVLCFHESIHVLSGDKQSRWRWARRIGQCLSVLLFVATIAWFTHSTWRPATPARIKAHVEAFDQAPHASRSWSDWEIVASWAIEAGLGPDLAGPRRLLAAEIAGKQNPFVLGSAFRVGLVRIEQIDQLSDEVGDYQKKRRLLLDDPFGLVATQPILSLDQEDWVIRASALRNDLTPEQRDFLAKRLHVNLQRMPEDPYRQLKEALRVTQMLEVIGRPIDRNRYRGQVHEWLREFHATDCGFFLDSGGFKTYVSSGAGDMQATACAVELMQYYGVPDGLDLNWVRSYLRPRFAQSEDDKFIAAATLARLDSLPGAAPPTWLDYVYYERSLIMALLLVGLCIYATLSSPVAKSGHSTANSSGTGQPETAPLPPS
jgi:hypothetical protein